jgi:hypothetical protein
MAANETVTNATDGGGAAPPPGGGPPSSVPGLDVAQRQLNRVMEMLREMKMVQQMQGALDGIGNALRNLGGGEAAGQAADAAGVVVFPNAAELAVHIHEVLP